MPIRWSTGAEDTGNVPEILCSNVRGQRCISLIPSDRAASAAASARCLPAMASGTLRRWSDGDSIAPIRESKEERGGESQLQQDAAPVRPWRLVAIVRAPAAKRLPLVNLVAAVNKQGEADQELDQSVRGHRASDVPILFTAAPESPTPQPNQPAVLRSSGARPACRSG